MAANVTERRFIEMPPNEEPAAPDNRMADMRRLIAAIRPPTTAAALRSLREAFPDIPLSERVRALDKVRH